MTNDLGKVLIILGLLLVVIGILLPFITKIPGLGKLPGDIFIKRDNFTFYFPLTTSILLSLILGLILHLWNQK